MSILIMFIPMVVKWFCQSGIQYPLNGHLMGKVMTGQFNLGKLKYFTSLNKCNLGIVIITIIPVRSQWGHYN